MPVAGLEALGTCRGCQVTDRRHALVQTQCVLCEIKKSEKGRSIAKLFTHHKGKGSGVGDDDRGERDGQELGVGGVRARGRGCCAALVEDVDLISGGVVDNLISTRD